VTTKKFTDDYIKRAMAKATGETIEFETSGSGLGIRCSASNVSFICQLKLPDGRRWRETIGRWGKLTVAQARDAVAVRAGKIANGVDLEEEARQIEAERRQREETAKREAAEAALTVRVLAERWHRQHLITNQRRDYAAAAFSRVLRHFESLLDVPAALIDRKAVRRVIKEMLDEGGPGPAAARNAVASFKAAFRWAAKRELIDNNPLANIELPGKGADRDRTLSIGEARQVFKAADRLPYPAGTFVRLLMLTGARRSEISGLLWKEIIDADDGPVLDLPGTRTKTGAGHRIPLSKAALAVIAECKRHRILGSVHVFTSDGAVAYRDFARTKRALDSEVEITPPWTFHDLRRSVVTYLASQNYNPVVIDKLLGHAPVKLDATARIYQRFEHADTRREMLEHWGTALTAPPAEVVRIKRQRGR
jgi:integrase